MQACRYFRRGCRSRHRPWRPPAPVAVHLRNHQSRQPEPLHHLPTLGWAPTRSSLVSFSHPAGGPSRSTTLGSHGLPASTCSSCRALAPLRHFGAGLTLPRLPKEQHTHPGCTDHPAGTGLAPSNSPTLGKPTNTSLASLAASCLDLPLPPLSNADIGHPLNGCRNPASASPQITCLGCTLPHRPDASPNVWDIRLLTACKGGWTSTPPGLHKDTGSHPKNPVKKGVCGLRGSLHETQTYLVVVVQAEKGALTHSTATLITMALNKHSG